MIPLFLRLVIRDDEKDRRGVDIWLPLFFFWILLSPLFVVLLVAWLLLVAAGRLSSTSDRWAKILEAAAVLIWNMNGLRVDIRNRKSRFVLHF